METSTTSTPSSPDAFSSASIWQLIASAKDRVEAKFEILIKQGSNLANIKHEILYVGCKRSSKREEYLESKRVQAQAIGDENVTVFNQVVTVAAVLRRHRKAFAEENIKIRVWVDKGLGKRNPIVGTAMVNLANFTNPENSQGALKVISLKNTKKSFTANLFLYFKITWNKVDDRWLFGKVTPEIPTNAITASEASQEIIDASNTTEHKESISSTPPCISDSSISPNSASWSPLSSLAASSRRRGAAMSMKVDPLPPLPEPDADDADADAEVETTITAHANIPNSPSFTITSTSPTSSTWFSDVLDEFHSPAPIVELKSSNESDRRASFDPHEEFTELLDEIEALRVQSVKNKLVVEVAQARKELDRKLTLQRAEHQSELHYTTALVDSLREKLAEKDSKITEMETAIDALQSKVTQELESTTSNVRCLTWKLSESEWELKRMRDASDEMEKERSDNLQGLASKDAIIKKLKEDLEATRTKSDQGEAILKEKLARRKLKHRETKEALKRRDAESREELSNRNESSNAVSLRLTLNVVRTELLTVREQLNLRLQECTILTKDLQESLSEQSTQREAAARSTIKLESAERDVKAKEAEIERLSKKSSRYKEQRQRMKQEIANLKENLARTNEGGNDHPLNSNNISPDSLVCSRCNQAVDKLASKDEKQAPRRSHTPRQPKNSEEKEKKKQLPIWRPG